MESDRSESNNNISLTEDQRKIYNELIKFVTIETKKKELLLIGYAGTGKTTLIAKFINDAIKNKLCKKIVIAAPTHKAVNIAKSKLFSNINSNETLSNRINIMTVHRLLNYKSYIDLNGNKYFAKNNSCSANWNIYNLIVVDECSMLSNQIINDIQTQLEEPNLKVKIIYVGDPAQLPPVNQLNSEIFEKNIKKLYLDKIVRTKNMKIMELSNDHRKWILSGKEEDIPEICKYSSKNIKIYSSEHNQRNIWLDKFISLLNKELKVDDNIVENNNIILTWTNNKCNLYNKYVREKIFNKKDLDYFEIGEILIFNDFYRIEKKVIEKKVDEKVDDNIVEYDSFYTSEQVKLIDIKKVRYKFNKLLYKINNNLPNKINEKFKKCINNLNKLLDTEIDIYEMKIKKLSDIKVDSITEIYEIFSIHPDSTKVYNNILEEFENYISQVKSKCYNIINELTNTDNMKKCIYQSELEKKINNLYKNWQDLVVDKFAQLNYGYSITVHKSQGSTFMNVFTDISDILSNNNQQETSKCLYTAITRSSKRLYLLI
jgi:tRNA A37 threonylcarbamoyladenosine biosynthesis protein TsaE